jgi:hypothetical protein
MPANKSNKKNGSADTSAQPDTIPFDRAVAEGKQILADAERGQWKLGELAHKVHPTYADRTLAKFAEAIGIAPCTLARHRDVFRAYPEYEAICGPGRESVSYAVLRELATHPDRARIIRENPKITKREALAEMRKLKGTAKEKQAQEQEDAWLKHNRKWFKDLVALANEATSAAGVPFQCTPEQLDNLLQAVDPGLLSYVRRSGNALLKLADYLEGLLEEAAEQEHSAPIARAYPEASVHVGA